MTIWQHVPFENEAAIGEWARIRGITYRIIRCWENEPLEADDLLVVLGGSMSAYDDIGFIKNEIEFLRKRIESGGKIFGICLGAQLLASAMGSRVYSSGTREAGWRNIDLMPHPLTDSLDKTQFHFETTAESMGKLLDADGEYLQSDSVFVADTDTIQSEAHHIPTANKTLFELLDRWNQTLS